MFFFRIALVFCGVALLLALAADLLLIGAGALLGSFAFFLKPSGWFALLGTLWIVAFAIGWLVLKKFHLVFPL